MKHKHLIGAIVGGFLGYYYATQGGAPGNTVVNPILIIVPKAVGITDPQIVSAAFAAEGAALGYLISSLF